MHKSTSSSRPLQSSPPRAGEGLVQVLWRVFRARSPGGGLQAYEQSVHEVHSDQPPSRAGASIKEMKIITKRKCVSIKIKRSFPLFPC